MHILRSTLIVSVTTLISRILGYVRDAITAAYMGTGIMNDAFIAAFKFTNLFRTLFGEGAFNAAFVPIFSSTLQTRGIKYAKIMASHLQSILLISLLIFSLIVIVGMPYLITVTTPGFIKDSDVFYLAVELGRITFPYLMLISLAAFYGGILNSRRIFMPYAATPIILNAVVIILLLCLQDIAETKAHALSYSVLAAGVLEFLWVFYFAAKNNMLIPLRKPRLSKYVKIMIKRMLPGIVGSGVAQINIWIDMIIVSFVPSGMSYLYFADRIMQLPLALIGTALGTVLLPAIATRANIGAVVEIGVIQNKSVKFSLFLAIPATVGLCMLSVDIIQVLFARGCFQVESVLGTSSALSALSLGLPAFILLKLVNTTFYAYGDTKIPVKISICALLTNVILSLSLVWKFKHVGVALSAVISAWIGLCIGVVFLSKKYKLHLKYDTVKSTGKSIIATACMGEFIYYVKHYVSYYNSKSIASLLCIILSSIMLYFCINLALHTRIRLKKSKQ
ncbi:putative lipid II flippase MurJ [Alphaproteobacteria bacterium]